MEKNSSNGLNISIPKISIFMMIFILTLLPTGYFLGINLKWIAFIFNVFAFSFFFLANSFDTLISRNITTIFLFLMSICFLFFLFIITILLNNAPLNFSFFFVKELFVIIFLCYEIYILYKEKIISHNEIFKTIFLSSFLFSTLKIIIFLFVLTEIFSFSNFTSFMQVVFNYHFTKAELATNLFRINFSNDIITPFLFFFVLFNKRFDFKLNSGIKIIFLLFALISIFITFSRFMFFITLLSLLLYFFYYRNFKIITFTVILSISIVFFNYDFFENLFILRFYSTATEYSDSIRDNQKIALKRDIEDYLYFGKGIGSYTRIPVPLKNLEKDIPIDYEVRWYSTLMQYGLFGITFFIFHLSILFFILISNLNLFRFFILTMYIIFILSGFFNPYITATSSTIIYIIFLISGLVTNNREVRSEQD